MDVIRRGRTLYFFVVIALLPWALVLGAEQANPAAALVEAVQRGQMKVVDLTHPLDDQSPYWPEGRAGSPFHARIAGTFEHDGYFALLVEFPEHFATHMDAPLHFDPQGESLDRIPVENFLSAAIVVDVRAATRSNQDYRVTAADLENWVRVYGPMPRSCTVLVRTGWASRWPSQRDYMNQDAQGVLHFPGLSVEAARYLLDHAHPVAIGIDTASIDYGPSKGFEAHHLTMRAGLYHLENLANLELLPETSACIIALPMKLRGGSGSPTRVVALVPAARASH